MNALFTYLDKIPKRVITLLGGAMVILLGAVDCLTSYEISFSVFYLLPIAFVSWFNKRTHGVIVSILSAATWLWADLSSGHIYSNSVIPVWNSVVRLGFFLIATFLLSKIKGLLEREQTFARIDFLTGIANSRAFDNILKIEIDRSARFGRPFTIAYIDVDNFKKVNDLFGHNEGDNLLRSIAKTIKDNTRSIDTVSRLGGDEFALLFPETNEENVKTVIDKVQTKLLGIIKNNNWPVTFSIGVVTCYKSCKLDELIKEADKLMYAVKESGKNGIKYKIYGVSADNA